MLSDALLNLSDAFKQTLALCVSVFLCFWDIYKYFFCVVFSENNKVMV